MENDDPDRKNSLFKPIAAMTKSHLRIEKSSKLNIDRVTIAPGGIDFSPALLEKTFLAPVTGDPSFPRIKKTGCRISG